MFLQYKKYSIQFINLPYITGEILCGSNRPTNQLLFIGVTTVYFFIWNIYFYVLQPLEAFLEVATNPWSISMSSIRGSLTPRTLCCLIANMTRQ